jgi:hypothetical protein
VDENLKCTWWLRRDRSWDLLKGQCREVSNIQYMIPTDTFAMGK